MGIVLTNVRYQTRTQLGHTNKKYGPKLLVDPKIQSAVSKTAIGDFVLLSETDMLFYFKSQFSLAASRRAVCPQRVENIRLRDEMEQYFKNIEANKNSLDCETKSSIFITSAALKPWLRRRR